MVRAARILGWIVLAQVALIAVTGVYLYFNYRPSPASHIGLSAAAQRSVRFRDLHVVQSRLLLLSGAAYLVLIVLALRWVRDIATAAVQFGALLVASITGLLLPWDQLALWSVTVGSNFHGFQTLVDSNQIRYVLIGHSEVSPGTVVRWLLVHVGVTVLGAAAAATALFRLHRMHAPRRAVTPAPTEQSVAPW